jgi:hypothetical protein
MTTAYTSLLGLALPVTGELSGTWGDTVNNSITSLLDSAVSGTTTISTDADITLSTTTGAANEAREATILWTAGGTATRNITAPAQSKVYVVINKSSSTQSIVLRGVGPTTGVTIVQGEKAVCAWNGTDFVKVANTSGAGAFTSLDYTTTLTGGTGIVNFGSGQFYKDASGNVGMGTASPQSKLHVYTGASGVTPNSESKLTVESSGTAAIGILAPAANESIVYFGNPTSNVDGGIVYNHNSRNMIFRTAGNTNRMRMDSTGRLIIGADTANASESKLEIRGPSNTGLSIYMLKAGQVEVNMGFGGGGDSNFYINSGSNTIGTSGVYLPNVGYSGGSVSDERMKTIIEPIENASAKVATLRTVIGYFNNDTTQTRRPFLIAQDVQAVLPEAVSVQNTETGTLGMSYTDTIPLLVAAINEQQALITSLTARVAALEGASA